MNCVIFVIDIGRNQSDKVHSLTRLVSIFLI